MSLVPLLLLLATPAAAVPVDGPSLPSGDGGEVRAALLDWQGAALPTGMALTAPVTLDRIGSPFGWRRDPLNRSFRPHRGVDLPGVSGTPVRAAADGVVSRAGRVGGYGNLVEIEHGDGRQTRYAHLSEVAVTPGMPVRQGEIVGLMGSTGRSTGSHLHFELRVDGAAADPLVELDGRGFAAPTPLQPVPSRWSGWGAATPDRLPSASIN